MSKLWPTIFSCHEGPKQQECFDTFCTSAQKVQNKGCRLTLRKYVVRGISAQMCLYDFSVCAMQLQYKGSLTCTRPLLVAMVGSGLLAEVISFLFYLCICVHEILRLASVTNKLYNRSHLTQRSTNLKATVGILISKAIISQGVYNALNSWSMIPYL